MDREAWRVAIHGVAKSRTRLSDWTELKSYYSLEIYFDLSTLLLRVYIVAFLVVAPGIMFHMQNLLQSAAATAAKSLQSCPTLCDPIEGSSLGSPILGILQARILECVAISFSNSWKRKVKVKLLIGARFLATPRTAAYRAPPSMDFPTKSTGVGCSLLVLNDILPAQMKRGNITPFTQLYTSPFTKLFVFPTLRLIPHCVVSYSLTNLEFFQREGLRTAS